MRLRKHARVNSWYVYVCIVYVYVCAFMCSHNWRCMRLCVQAGQMEEAAACIRSQFSQTLPGGPDGAGVARVKYPVHAVARGYVVLGDIASSRRAFAVAEAYYWWAMWFCMNSFDA